MRLALPMVVVLAAAAAAGCGGRVAGTSACGARAGRLLTDADRVLVYNRATAASPADLALFGFGDDLVAFQRQGCAPALLGTAFQQRLTADRVAELRSHLTAPMTRYLDTALTCAGRRDRSAACSGAAAQAVAGERPTASNPFTP